MAKGGYVDGFVFTVPKKNVAKYKKMAEEGRRSWMRHGALAYYECMENDLKVRAQDGMKPRSFKEVAKAGSSETVWFSFIIFRDKKHRDAVNKKVMAEMDKDADKWKDFVMPNDPNKMAYGGFKGVVVG